MGTVFKKTVTRPLPKGAELFTKNGQRFARWKPAKGGKSRTAKVTTGTDGSPRILDESGTQSANDENITMPSEKALSAVVEGKALKVGAIGRLLNFFRARFPTGRIR